MCARMDKQLGHSTLPGDLLRKETVSVLAEKVGDGASSLRRLVA